MRYSFLVFLLFFAIFPAQHKLELRPVPKSVASIGESISFPKGFKLNTRKAPKNIAQEIRNEFSNDSGGMRLVFSVKKQNQQSQKEGYTLKIDKKNIAVTGNDERGLYYGILTLKQILEQARSTGKLPLLEIVDAPDVAYRGVVEGFYGTPWTFDARMSQLEFYGKNKLNTYIYAPKDDPYHSSPNWRKPYPEADAALLKTLINQAEKYHVDFVWAIHPGQDIQWNEVDRAALLNKFNSMYSLGVRSFAVFFDDISGEGTRPEKQADLLNYLDDEFVQKKSDVKPLIMCPTEYNKAWSDPKRGYLKTLGSMLHANIQIMWTGDSVIGDVSEKSVDWIKEQLGRDAFFWWNFPVSDYVRDHLLMGLAYGLDAKTKNNISGLVSNPMEHAEASKPAIYSVAQFAWNMNAYDSDKAWREGLRLLMPKNYEALQVFANHNSDAGQNGHRYRREESADFQPVAAVFTEGLYADTRGVEAKKIADEFQNIIRATDVLLQSDENPALLSEIRPWAVQLKNLGNSGLSVMALYEAYFSGNQEAFLKAHQEVLKWEKTMYDYGTDPAINPNRPGLKPGSLVLKPLVENVFTAMTQRYNKKYDANLSVYSRFSPHKIYTDIPRLEVQPLIVKEKSVEIAPVLETVAIAPKKFFGILLEKVSDFKTLVIDVQDADFEKFFLVETSEDGKNWTKMTGTFTSNSSQWTAKSNGKEKYLRMVNVGNKEKTIRLKLFRINF